MEAINMSPPLYDKKGELCHIRDTGSELVIKSLRGQYKTEMELNALLSFLFTLEKLGLM